MSSFNKVVLIGNITQDIELRKTPKGTSVIDINLALNRVRTSETGERIEETTFVDVTIWGRTAEVVHQYAKKGSPLMVEGRLHMDTWVDKTTGGNCSKLKVIGENIQLLGTKGGNTSSHSARSYEPNATQSQPQERSVSDSLDDLKDVPF